MANVTSPVSELFYIIWNTERSAKITHFYRSLAGDFYSATAPSTYSNLIAILKPEDRAD